MVTFPFSFLYSFSQTNVIMLDHIANFIININPKYCLVLLLTYILQNMWLILSIFAHEIIYHVVKCPSVMQDTLHAALYYIGLCVGIEEICVGIH